MFRDSVTEELVATETPRFLLPAGMAKEVRDRTIIMAIEFYVDESGGDKSAGRYLSIAGLMAEHSRWVGFEKDWRKALKLSGLPYPFHMKEFVSKCKTLKVTLERQNELLAPLGDVIAAHAEVSSHISLDVEAFNVLNQPVRPFLKYDNWVAGVLRLVWSATHYLWQNGHRERFRVVLDEKKPQQYWAQALYADVREIIDYQYPFQATIMPNQLEFDTDDNVPPLQPADIYAWNLRKSGVDGFEDEHHPFNPLLKGHLQGVGRALSSEFVTAEQIHPLVKTGEILLKYRNGPGDPSLLKERLFGDLP